MYIKNNKGFSLVEIVIATGIITISVFGVYKLIGENTKIINNSSIYLQANSLFPVLQECIKNKVNTFNLTTGTGVYFYINNVNGCNKISNKSGTIIDDIQYNLSAKIIDSSGSYNNWELYIETDLLKTQTGFYYQIKK